MPKRSLPSEHVDCQVCINLNGQIPTWTFWNIFRTSKCINMRTTASRTWLIRCRYTMMNIADINLNLKTFGIGIPQTGLA